MSETVFKDSTNSIVVPAPVFDYPAAMSAVEVKVMTPAVALPDAWSSVGVTIDNGLVSLRTAAAVGDTGLDVDTLDTVTSFRPYEIYEEGLPPFRVNTTNRGGINPPGGTIYLEKPLLSALPVGAAMVGVSFALALTAEQTANVGHGLIKVKGTMASGGVEFWDVPFYIANQDNGYQINRSTLLDYQPAISRHVADFDRDFRDVTNSAYRILYSELEGRGFIKDRIKSPERFDQAVAALILARLYQDINGAGSAPAETMKFEYLRLLDTAIKSSSFWYDSSDSNSDTAGDDLGGRTFIRITR